MTGLKNAKAVENTDDYRNVFVFLEVREGKFLRSALEMIGVGRDIARKVNEKLVCLILGNNISKLADEAVEYGADLVLGAESPDLEEFRTLPYTSIVSDWVMKEKPNIFLIPASRNGRDLASRIAVKCQAGVTADCTELDIEHDTRILSANRPTYGESMLAEILCRKHRPQMATARPGIFKVPEKSRSENPEIRISKVKVDKSLKTKEIIEFRKKEKVDLSAAKIIVSGGLGLGKAEGFKALEKLAKTIGGEVGASRPAADLGWISRDHQVGQTGQTVRPRLYIAAGISGKIQHIMGMKNSENILAINIDPNAEIVTYSDYVIVGDVKDVIPRLQKEIDSYRKEHSGKKESKIASAS
ncbi:MAG: electron transfer flavoprotein subunit alpha/FixB family protein [Candidatus Thermoplasmatota archaeon]|nr:electron transfer flavoprotein subunit alpha/FixB family protein [Candidatus Thermoplasmatota archaeon]MCL5437575.1 electron transfer flavoprotein subunit alpha/FixB family protein [Candidatus Thermoplasmatota archaeon]